MINYDYNYPAYNDPDHQDLFSFQSEFNFFATARGVFSYLGTYSDFSGIPAPLCWHIPMGYTTLTVFERLSIVSMTGIEWENPDKNAFLRSNMGRDIYDYQEKCYIDHAYAIIDQDGKRHTPEHKSYFHKYIDAIDFAKNLASTSNTKYLVCKVLAFEDTWH